MYLIAAIYSMFLSLATTIISLIINLSCIGNEKDCHGRMRLNSNGCVLRRTFLSHGFNLARVPVFLLRMTDLG